MIQELTRKQILEGSYEWPKDLVHLVPTKHFNDRIDERGWGLVVVPTQVRVTKDNIYSGKTTDGVKLTSVVIKLEYSPYKYIFLVLNPYDGGLKTIWFSDIKRRENGKWKRRINRENSQQAIRDDRIEIDTTGDT